MTGNPSPDEQRDQGHLGALRAARAAGDEFAARKALADLVDPYRQVTRNIAYGRLEGVPNRSEEATRIAQDVMVRVVAALNKRLNFPMPFHVVVAANREFALKDFWEEYLGEQARPYEPTELVDLAGAAEPGPTDFEQARVFEPYLEGLTTLERELVIERIFLDMTPQQSADKRGMKRNAVDQAYHRAVKKLRANRPRPDVRDQDEGAA
jgi:DNA-directed RNA polymerase specialized sigma24 family protein